MTQHETDLPIPVVVDVGATRKKKIKQLKKGEGSLMNEVKAIIREVEATHAEQLGDRKIWPVVLIYRQKKSKRKRLGGVPFPRLFGR